MSATWPEEEEEDPLGRPEKKNFSSKLTCSFIGFLLGQHHAAAAPVGPPSVGPLKAGPNFS